ncbi:MAG: DUF1778 domain-containing protein [Lewinellaceae bacterium]|nr:DUF1778 domain-containing protein [Saprospiraceae bacterium]MCB9314364.1 DUF1778 domain-containing protein [Lewinellaceae bacterium]HRW76519.1 DUF1778 domain-containing protein [Saprospiraceae bacterium]
MDSISKERADERIELRVTRSEKLFWQEVMRMRNFSSFSEFIRTLVSNAARDLYDQEKRILASKRDAEIFFDVLAEDDIRLNEALTSAIREYKDRYS